MDNYKLKTRNSFPNKYLNTIIKNHCYDKHNKRVYELKPNVYRQRNEEHLNHLALQPPANEKYKTTINKTA